METENWVQEQLNHLMAASKDYRQKALFQETKKLFQEQYQRIEQMEGELDGRIWSPKEWSDYIAAATLPYFDCQLRETGASPEFRRYSELFSGKRSFVVVGGGSYRCTPASRSLDGAAYAYSVSLIRSAAAGRAL